jgi:hypothetical protein
MTPRDRKSRPGSHHGLQDVPDEEVHAVAARVAKHACGLTTVEAIAKLTLAVAYERGWRPKDAVGR